QDLISQFVETLGVSKKDYAKTMDILILKNMITVFDENIPEPTANSLLPFEMLAVGMMYAAGADSEVSLAENAYIASMFKDDLAVYLEKASAYYKTHSYSEFLDSRKNLNVKQCSCLLANMVELSMADGKLNPVKKKILEQFKDTVITDKEYAKIFDVLALKNKISEFTEITP
ncbi:MAG: hypothetical protein NT118_02240, partial [Lentisphaerae bacterium]|nr:hypothetical protein [Lentisphaerota bacterium]